METGISAAAISGSIVNADVSATAAIAYSKLNLALSIVNADISASAAIGIAKLASYPADATKFLRGDATWAVPLPAGIVQQYAGTAAPTGYALCDGSSYLRADGIHDTLFAAIGTAYGAVDGTHFSVPDFRGRVPVGYAASGGHVDVSTLANSDGVAVANRRPKHQHTAHAHSGVPLQSGLTNNVGGDRSLTLGSTNTNSADGGSGNVNDSVDAPAYLVVNYIIKL